MVKNNKILDYEQGTQEIAEELIETIKNY